MKKRKLKTNLFLYAGVLIFLISACKYEVTEPLWEKDFQPSENPSISEVIPDPAVPGVNTIAIRGQHLATGGVKVYFDSWIADIIDTSDNQIVVRRPNYVSEGCTIKVVPNRALTEAKYAPYRIDPVGGEFGKLTSEDKLIEMLAPVVDEDENLYVTRKANPRTILRIDSTGNITEFAVANRNVSSATYFEGKIYLMADHPAIDMLDTETGEVTEWLRAQGRIHAGEFSSEGYFYCGGNRTDLVVIAPDQNIQKIGLYTTLNIRDVRVAGGYVYIAAEPLSGNISTTIYRHPILEQGTLGEQEVVVALAETPFADRTFVGFVVAADDKIFIVTDNDDPLLVFDPESQEIDYFYKSIIPAPCVYFAWGSKNYLYLELKEDANFYFYRVDMGITAW